MSKLKAKALRLGAGESVQVSRGLDSDENPHMHQEFQVTIAIAGRHLESLGGSERVCMPGDVSLIESWTPHGWQTVDEAHEEAILRFLPDFLGDADFGGLSWLLLFSADAADRYNRQATHPLDQAVAAGREMLREAESRAFGWQDMVRLELLRLLGWMMRSLGREALVAVRGEKTALLRIMPAVRLVHAEPTRRITVAEAAQACGFNRTYFHELFGRAMGVTFGAYAQSVRLGHVGRMLLHTDLPIDSIAAEMDFSDGSHLHRAFVRSYGVSPAHYRRQRPRGSG